MHCLLLVRMAVGLTGIPSLFAFHSSLYCFSFLLCFKYLSDTDYYLSGLAFDHCHRNNYSTDESASLHVLKLKCLA